MIDTNNASQRLAKLQGELKVVRGQRIVAEAALEAAKTGVAAVPALAPGGALVASVVPERKIPWVAIGAAAGVLGVVFNAVRSK